ncbi:MAG: STT3 domain-containing protein [Desulfovibrionaceae bacterium]
MTTNSGLRGWLTASGAGENRLRADWKILLLACLLAYAVGLGLRLLEVPAWDHPGLRVGADHILATHDSYFWLAGADNVRRTYNSELASLINVLSGLTGADKVSVAFWGPAFIAPLVGVVGALWGWLLAGRNGALLCGVLAGVAPGFFRRTRLGYYDTDLFTLLAPFATAFFLAFLLRAYVRRSWVRSPEEQDGSASITPFLLVLPLGFLARMGWWFHQDIFSFGLVLLALAFGLAALLGRREQRGETFLLLAFFGIVAFWGREGTGVAYRTFGAFAPLFGAALVAVWIFLPAAARKRAGSVWAGLGVFAGVVLLGNFLGWPLSSIIKQLSPYLKPVADTVATQAQLVPPVYPAIAQSIIEAKNVPLAEVLMRLGPFSWLAPLGIVGLLAACLRRPLAVLLLPLLGLGLAGGILGVRFTMFGGAAVAVGLGVCVTWALDWLLARKSQRGWLHPVIQLALASVLVAGLGVTYKALPLTPVLDRPHAEGLVELGKLVEKDATVWTWWDYGYVTQFYTKRTTPSDGGLHAGREIYATALALSSDSLQQAANIIKYSAARDNRPAQDWDRMGGAQARAEVRDLLLVELPAPEKAQYLVVPWAAMNILKWISYFGTWDLESGGGFQFAIQRITTPFHLDTGLGALIPDDGQRPLPLSSVDLVDGQGYKHHDFYQNSGAPHLVINKGQRSNYLLDDRAYRSTLVQLLVGDPVHSSIAERFELVVEGSPHFRAYRVK